MSDRSTTTLPPPPPSTACDDRDKDAEPLEKVSLFKRKRTAASSAPRNLRAKRQAADANDNFSATSTPAPASSSATKTSSAVRDAWAAEDHDNDPAATIRRNTSRRNNRIKRNPLVQRTGTSSSRRRAGTDDDDDDDSDSHDDRAAQPKFAYKAARNLVKTDNGATRYAEWDAPPDVDEQKAKAVLDKHHADIQAEDDGLYRGQAQYKSYISKREGGPTNSKMQAGPIRAPANVRAISVMDYQPDICKDYKETGYCGYGDSCKFLHDRGDYKSGWQLEREWEQNGRIGREHGNEFEVKSDDDSDDELPFACIICREDFKRPVKTRCGHFFCEKCALAHYAKTNKCFACHAATGGVFNTAKDLLAKLEAKKKRMAEEGGDATANFEVESAGGEEDDD